MRAVNVLTLAFSVCVFFLGIAVIAWALIRTGYFVSPVKIAIYLVIPGMISVSGLFLIFTPAGLRLIVCLCGVAIGVALLLHEAYWQLSQHDKSTNAATASAERSKAAGEQTYPVICGQTVMTMGPAGLVRSAIVVDGKPVQTQAGPAGKLVRRTLDTVDRKFTVGRTDRFGFNNPPGQWTAEEVKALILGDSFAYGAEVPFGRGMADHIRAHLGPTVNLACGGNGPLLALASLQEYGVPLRPQIVLWFYYEGNDLTKDIVKERKSTTLLGYLDPEFSQNLMARQHKINEALLAFIYAKLEDRRKAPPTGPPPITFSWRDAVRLSGLRNALGMNYEFAPESLILFQRALARARDMIATWKGRLVFVYLPGEVRFTSPFAQWDSDGYRRAILDVVRSEGIDVIDIVQAFATLDRPRRLYRGHFTEEGHRFVAERVLERLKQP